MKYTSFVTNTLLDIRAITTFGLHAKPNTVSPIGYFGTGLKMAIAVLAREGIPVELFIGDKHYAFKQKNIEFRDKEFGQVVMGRKDGLLAKWQTIELPFTTELAKNWELWMAYRELASNTIDENGGIFVHEDSKQGWNKDQTLIVVHGDKFADIHEDRDTIFLPGASRRHIADVPGIEIFQEPSKYVFYRGMRVLELKKPSMLTYNVVEQHQLTEDRTIKDQFWLEYKIAEWLMTKAGAPILNHMLNATDQNWEWDLPFDIVSSPLSTTFREVYKKRTKGQLSKLKELDESLTPKYLSSSGRLSEAYNRSSRMLIPHSLLLSTRFKEWRETYVTSDTDQDLLNEVYTFIDDNEDKYE